MTGLTKVLDRRWARILCRSNSPTLTDRRGVSWEEPRRRKVGVAEPGKQSTRHQKLRSPRAIWWLSTPGLIFTLHPSLASIWEDYGGFGRLGVEEGAAGAMPSFSLPTGQEGQD